MLVLRQGRTSFMYRVESNHRNVLYCLNTVFDDFKDFEYDREIRRYKLSNYYYRHDPAHLVGILPIAALPKLLNILKRENIKYTISIVDPITPTRYLDAQMKPGWEERDELQKEAVKYLTTTKYDPTELLSAFLPLALQTGKGKTYIAIKSAVTLNLPTLIIVSGLLEQWKESWLEQTTISEDDIYYIRGYKSIDDLLRSDYRPKVVIASLETMRDFTQQKGTYTHFPWDMNDLVEHCQLGIKIIDEVHLNFHAIVQLDLVSNFMYNFYLSATYGRSNPSTAKVFEQIYPAERRWGDEYYTKYVDVQMINHDLWVPLKFISYGGNYSHFKYEQYVYKNPAAKEKIFKLWKFAIEHRYLAHRQPGDRLLIYVSKVETSLVIASWIRMQYPQFTCETYTQKDPDSHLEADIVVSTPKSAGVGTDIDRLLAVINSVSLKSEFLTVQMLGRLRERKDGQICRFTDFCNRMVPAQIEHGDERMYLYRQLAKTFNISKF